ncbi:MAG: hypothetical protein JWO94_1105, partial [Verrucomicrobiaceae bacterium]|nr:hypothetical protein [Verrucomicrobiaceae bacterium]
TINPQMLSAPPKGSTTIIVTPPATR